MIRRLAGLEAVVSRVVATPAPLVARWPVRAEHVTMATAAIALAVLVVLPERAGRPAALVQP